ncbi:hypothetical protein LOCC1_G004337 [Lachnellula occidentalis]|uniref:Uncharacterized protein n=1 Tax=Lachnellula occidentalis TaxID=215460 RepID=A0A8H8RW21_9HELO|nr:hypothetical protein LOCC1_G004337 [Lachnellula occidentalis]
MLSKIFIFALLNSLICASAIPNLRPFNTTSPISRRALSAADVLLQIAPTSNTCSGAAFPTECATNVQAAPWLIAAMAKYGITSAPETAAVLSLIAFESGDFKFNTNHFPAPGRPGQGTRNMQMASYNLMYAKSIPELAGKVTAGQSAEQLNAVRALVLPDQYSWASGAWFFTTQCASVRSAVQAGGDAGFAAYMGCIGTPVTPDRKAYWDRANAAFGG